MALAHVADRHLAEASQVRNDPPGLGQEEQKVVDARVGDRRTGVVRQLGDLGRDWREAGRIDPLGGYRTPFPSQRSQGLPCEEPRPLHDEQGHRPGGHTAMLATIAVTASMASRISLTR